MASDQFLRSKQPSRRDWIQAGGASLSACALAGSAFPSLLAGNLLAAGSNGPRLRQDEPSKKGPAALRHCFNTATLRGQKMPISRLVDLVADGGYDGIEVWIDELDRHVQEGGSLADLKKQIDDRGLRVESAIAFANWLAPEEATAIAEVEKAKRDMEKVLAIGGQCIAAPPAGQNDIAITDWNLAAARLQALSEAGKQIGVEPQLEVWGFSKAIGNISQALTLASLVEGSDFGILLDVYHLYKGGSPFSALRMVSGSAMKLFHINDYPAMPERATISDKDRVFPGKGVAPLDFILRTLVQNGFQGALSLELFNPDYWQREPQWVIENGLAHTKAALASALNGIKHGAE